MAKPYLPQLHRNYNPAYDRFPPPPIQSACDEPLVCVAFSAEFIPYLLGLLEIYRWHDMFRGTDAEKQHGVDVFSELITILMTAQNCCCGSVNTTVVIHQVNAITFGLEISTDNGETWQPDPEDPRNLIVALPTPVASGVASDKCEAATLGVVHLQEIKDNVTPLVGVAATLFEVALDVLLAILAIWIGNAKADSLIALVIDVVHALRDATLEEWEGIWTTEVWDKVLCAFYCHLSPDGSFTDEGYAGLVNECQSVLPGGTSAMGARSWIHVFLTVLGRAGVNNLCAYGDPQGADCSDCDCACDTDIWQLFDGSHGVEVNRSGDWIEVQATETIPGQYFVILTTGDANLCCLIDSSEYEYTAGSGEGVLLSWFECGEYYPAEVHSGLMGERCTPLVQIQSANPFTIKVHFHQCV